MDLQYLWELAANELQSFVFQVWTFVVWVRFVETLHVPIVICLTDWTLVWPNVIWLRHVQLDELKTALAEVRRYIFK
jgi:hypothetical protein